MGGVFISYRRSDSSSTTGRLHDYLSQELYPTPVFRDIYALMPGAPYEEAIRQALGSAGVVLVIIGPHWLDASDARGPRLYDPGDLLRAEIARALAWNIPVIPVLVDGASMPAVTDLPPDLQRLRTLQSIKLSDEHWHDQAPRLLDAITAIIGFPPAAPVHAPTPVVTRNRGCALGGIAGMIMFLLVIAAGVTVVVMFVWPFISGLLETPSITLSKSSGPPGTELTVGGEGFLKGETVVIRFHTEEVGRFKADGDGNFDNKKVAVPSDWPFTGQFDFVASGNTSAKSARLPFRVT